MAPLDIQRKAENQEEALNDGDMWDTVPDWLEHLACNTNSTDSNHHKAVNYC